LLQRPCRIDLARGLRELVVRAADDGRARCLTFDDQSTGVVRQMMALAQRDEVLDLMSAALLPRHDVVDIEVARGSAAGHATPAVVPPLHEPPCRGGNILLCAL